MKIIIGCDHGGFTLKQDIVDYLTGKNIDITDVGTDSEDSVDYPDYGAKVAQKVSDGSYERGIVLCGSGIGISIVANKFPGVRAALCMTPEQAELSIQHNNANILALGGRMTDAQTARAILDRWLTARFEGGRHERRVEKIHEITGI